MYSALECMISIKGFHILNMNGFYFSQIDTIMDVETGVHPPPLITNLHVKCPFSSCLLLLVRLPLNACVPSTFECFLHPWVLIVTFSKMKDIVDVVRKTFFPKKVKYPDKLALTFCSSMTSNQGKKILIVSLGMCSISIKFTQKSWSGKIMMGTIHHKHIPHHMDIKLSDYIQDATSVLTPPQSKFNLAIKAQMQAPLIKFIKSSTLMHSSTIICYFVT